MTKLLCFHFRFFFVYSDWAESKYKIWIVTLPNTKFRDTRCESQKLLYRNLSLQKLLGLPPSILVSSSVLMGKYPNSVFKSCPLKIQTVYQNSSFYLYWRTCLGRRKNKAKQRPDLNNGSSIVSDDIFLSSTSLM